MSVIRVIGVTIFILTSQRRRPSQRNKQECRSCPERGRAISVASRPVPGDERHEWRRLALTLPTALSISRTNQARIQHCDMNGSSEKGRANWQFALTPSMWPFGKTKQTASFPYPRNAHIDLKGRFGNLGCAQTSSQVISVLLLLRIPRFRL